MKKLFGMVALAITLLTAPAFAADAPTLHNTTVCSPTPAMNIDGLVSSFEATKDKLPAGTHLEFVDGAALTDWDAKMQAAGGPALPDQIKAIVFVLEPGWDDNGQNPVTMIMFDANGCFIAGKQVPSEFVIKGEGRNV